MSNRWAIWLVGFGLFLTACGQSDDLETTEIVEDEQVEVGVDDSPVGDDSGEDDPGDESENSGDAGDDSATDDGIAAEASGEETVGSEPGSDDDPATSAGVDGDDGNDDSADAEDGVDAEDAALDAQDAEDDAEDAAGGEGRVGAGLPSGVVIDLTTGQQLDLGDTLANAGGPVLLWFWAPDNGPSQAESAVVQQLADEHGDGVVIVAVGTGGVVEEAQAFADDVALDGVTVVWDGTAGNAEQYGVNALPSSVLLDNEGNIIARWVTLSEEAFGLIDLLT